MIPSINTTHRFELTTGSFGAEVTFWKLVSASPMVKIPPLVVPVVWERESWKVMTLGSEGLASKI
jgi:hypothetical protein